jgi:hemerythrin-like domain-containing protein
MTILDDLKADHRELKAEIRAILKSDDREERVARFSHFRTLLTAHSRAEENVLYGGLEKFEKGKDEALEGTVEHEVADRLVEDLSASRNFEADKWTARCTVLKELLEHHIEEEEDEMFKTARKQFDKKALDEMGKEFKNEKAKYGMPTTDAK